MMNRKWMALALASVLSLSVFTGCGQGASSTKTASSGTSSEVSSDVSKKTDSGAVVVEVDAEGFGVFAAPETVVAKQAVNVRKSPDKEADILGVLSKGAEIKRVAANDVWSRVDYNGSVAYVVSEFLAANGKTAEGSQATNPEGSQATNPEGSQGTNPEGSQGTNPEGGQGTNSEGSQGTNPEGSQGTNPEGSQGTNPEGTQSTAPEGSQATNPEGTQSQAANPQSGTPDYSALMNWDLASLPNDLVPFGYDANDRDERNIPNGWSYYENLWGKFNVDWIGDTSKNVIYLTMDEGYANTNTETILDTLAAKGVKAVFFLTWNFVTERPDLVRRMIDEGHMLGNHTVSHKSMSTLSIEEQTREVMDLENYVEENFGYKMVLFRYPEGAFSEQSMGLINNLGFKVSFWSYAYRDYEEVQVPVEEALPMALNAVHPGAIYLLHAKSDTNTAMLADFIDGVRAKGFDFGVYDLSAK